MSAEKKRLTLLVAVLAVIAILSFWPGRSAPAPASASRAARNSAREADGEGAHAAAGRRSARPGTGHSIDPEAIPTLAIEVGRGPINIPVQRNVFRFYDRPTPVPTRPLPPPTPFPQVGDPRFIGPLAPTPIPPPTPIIPPAIPYKAVGIFGPKEQLIVALEDNGRLINAREGDTLDGRFILRRINKESIDFAFVGLPADITRRLAVAVEAGR